MSGVDIAGLVEELRRNFTIDINNRKSLEPFLDKLGKDRGRAADALLAQAAELAEAREESLRKDLQMATLRNQRDAARGRAGEQFVRCGEALQRAVIATRQRDEALAALKAKDERIKAAINCLPLIRDAGTQAALQHLRAALSDPGTEQREAGR